MRVNKKSYRKYCHNCGDFFKGRKDAKFCSALCRVTKNRQERASSLYKQISKLLAIEFEAIDMKDASKVVKICVAAIKRAKKAQEKGVILTFQDVKSTMSTEEKRQKLAKLTKK